MRSIKQIEVTRSLAGKAAVILRARAVERYNLNPNICKFCKKIIELGDQKPFEARKKLFCNHSCAAKFNNKPRPNSKNRKPCAICGKIIRNLDSVHCADCRIMFLYEQTGNLPKGQVSRERLSTHARWIMKYEPYECLVCGYNFAVEAAHIKPVKSYSPDTLVKDINLLENLLLLCPNHHLEFDRGKLKLEDIRSSGTRVAA